MSGDEEPARNIGVGHGSEMGEDATEPSGGRGEAVMDRLGELYWRKTYGGREAFRCLVRTILSQNTSDAASQPAFEELLDRFDNDDLAAELRDAPQSAIADAIRDAGLYNQKAEVIQSCADRILEEFGDTHAFDRFVAESDDDTARERLLSFDGVGPKTADCVLLFAGGREGVFPVDTHVHRVARRLGLVPPDATHEEVRAILEADTSASEQAVSTGYQANAIPPEKCGFGHTAMIQFGRDYCTARNPACLDDPDACPLAEYCDQVGVDPETQTVRDPSEAREG